MEKKVVGAVGHGKAGLQKEIIKALQKQGIIIAVYPEMGQELLSDMHDNYAYLSGYHYNQTKENWARSYVEDAIDLVTLSNIENPQKSRRIFDICFVDAIEPLLDELANRNEPYIIFYPNTSKESVLQMMAQMYLANPHNNSAKTLANAILNYDKHIEHLRLYPNSIAASTGIINEDFVRDLAKMSQLDRIQVIQAFVTIKTSKKTK